MQSAGIAVQYSFITAAARGSSAPGYAILRTVMGKAVIRMAEDKNLTCYLFTMRIAKQWLSSGLITAEDYKKFDTITAEKFGVSARSIWRDIYLLSGPPDGNMPPTKGGISSGTHHSTGSADEAG